MSTQHTDARQTEQSLNDHTDDDDPLGADVAELVEHEDIRNVFARAARLQSDHADLPGGLKGLAPYLCLALDELGYDADLTDHEAARLLERGAGWMRREVEAAYADLEDHEQLIARLTMHRSELRDSRDRSYQEYDELRKKTAIRAEDHE